jgi:hypothetical protein
VRLSPDAASIASLQMPPHQELDDPNDLLPGDRRRYDFVAYIGNGLIGADITVVHGPAPSMARKSVATVLQERYKRKLKRYDGRVWPLVMSSYGGVHERFASFVKKLGFQFEDLLPQPDLAARKRFTRELMSELSISLQRSQALALGSHLAALRL